MLKLNPYGGTRHTAMLTVSMAAGVGLGIAALCSLALGRWTPQPALAVLLVAAVAGIEWPEFADHRKYDYISPGHDKKYWHEAVKHIRDNVPPGSIIFTEHATCLNLGYYLAKDEPSRVASVEDGLLEFRYGGYRIVMTDRWLFGYETFFQDLNRFRDAYRIGPNQPVWVIGGARHLRTAVLSNTPDAPHWPSGEHIILLKVPGR
jgi:hypothetical protein